MPRRLPTLAYGADLMPLRLPSHVDVSLARTAEREAAYEIRALHREADGSSSTLARVVLPISTLDDLIALLGKARAMAIASSGTGSTGASLPTRPRRTTR